VLLLLTWLWRWLVVAFLLWRISRLDLRLVPSHADRAGGLGFLDLAGQVLLPVLLALSVVIAAQFGHDVRYHNVKVESLYGAMAALALVFLVVTLGPLLSFSGPLARLKQRSRLDYSRLVAQHGRLLDRRWIYGEALADDSVLTSPELGPAIDVASLHDIVRGMRLVLFSRELVLLVVGVALLPMLPVLALQIPLMKLLEKLGSIVL
jgi:hypothetical protein